MGEANRISPVKNFFAGENFFALFNLICLLDGNADADRIYGSFDQNLFLFITRDHNWIQEQFFTSSVTVMVLVSDG